MVEKLSTTEKLKKTTIKLAAALATSAFSLVGCSAVPAPVVPEHVVTVTDRDDNGNNLLPGAAGIAAVCHEAFRQADEELKLTEEDARADSRRLPRCRTGSNRWRHRRKKGKSSRRYRRSNGQNER